MDKVIDTRVVKKFLSDEELEYFENSVPKDEKYWFTDIDSKTGKKVAETVKLLFDDAAFKKVADLLLPKIRENFGSDLKIDSAHILNSYNPYGVHTDVLSGNYDANNHQPYPDNLYPAWTFLIPLGDYDSSTIVFQEESPRTKVVIEWAKNNRIKPNKHAIDQETRKKYLSHITDIELNFLHVEQIYKWERGDCFAASRTKFHTSDNYIANGIESKRAIIIWTSIPLKP